MKKLAWSAALIALIALIALAVFTGSGSDPADAPTGRAPRADQAVPTKVWGWISAIETNSFADGDYVLEAGWYGGVRAYFATQASWPRALAYDLGYAEAVASSGACTLYDPGIFGEGCEDCACLDKGLECRDGFDKRWCGPDEMCVQGPERPESWPDRGVCEALPAHFDVGTIEMEGLKLKASMSPDDYDRYMRKDLPGWPDLFDDGDVVTARTSGGSLPPLTLSARGVAPLTIKDKVVHVKLGRASVVRWVPADPDARVLIVLRAGSHDPYPVSGAIVCEADDAAGEVEVSADLLQKLHALGCNGAYMLKTSVIFRYQREVKVLAQGAVELFVASARLLQLAFD